jgi:hypothetical protein
MSTDQVPTARTCYDCGEAVVSVVRNGWAMFAHADEDGRGHPVRVQMPPIVVPTDPPTAHIVDCGGHLATYVDRHDGRPWTLRGTTPTWRGAAYPEARERGWNEGVAIARGWAAEYDDRPVTVESA